MHTKTIDHNAGSQSTDLETVISNHMSLTTNTDPSIQTHWLQNGSPKRDREKKKRHAQKLKIFQKAAPKWRPFFGYHFLNKQFAWSAKWDHFLGLKLAPHFGITEPIFWKQLFPKIRAFNINSTSPEPVYLQLCFINTTIQLQALKLIGQGFALVVVVVLW